MEEITMKEILENLEPLLNIVAITIITIFLIIYMCRIIIVIFTKKHEKGMKELEFKQKKEWESFIMENITKKKEDEETKKMITDYKKKIDDLYENRNKPTPLDMNRISLLHLILSGNKNGITAENLEKEMNKVKESYEIIKNYLKD